MNIRELIVALEDAAKEYGDFVDITYDLGDGRLYPIENLYEEGGEVVLE